MIFTYFKYVVCKFKRKLILQPHMWYDCEDLLEKDIIVITSKNIKVMFVYLIKVNYFYFFYDDSCTWDCQVRSYVLYIILRCFIQRQIFYILFKSDQNWLINFLVFNFYTYLSFSKRKGLVLWRLLPLYKVSTGN